MARKPKSEKKDKEAEENKKEQISSGNKQTTAIIIIVAIIGFAIAGFIFYKDNYITNFNYNGLQFTKNIVGKVVIYSTQAPIYGTKGNIIGNYQLNLRNDPRKLRSIESEIGDLEFNKNKIIYVTFDPAMKSCEDNILAAADLTSFLKDFTGATIKGALTDKEEANKSKLEYITCENAPKNTVILVKSAEESYVNRISANCFEIAYKECEIKKACEKFTISMIERYIELASLKTIDTSKNESIEEVNSSNISISLESLENAKTL
ncbi:MAG: hypothetical protein ACP5OG_01140 [Candidatus Nanoarchaeia archaeon]